MIYRGSWYVLLAPCSQGPLRVANSARLHNYFVVLQLSVGSYPALWTDHVRGACTILSLTVHEVFRFVSRRRRDRALWR